MDRIIHEKGEARRALRRQYDIYWILAGNCGRAHCTWIRDPNDRREISDLGELQVPSLPICLQQLTIQKVYIALEIVFCIILYLVPSFYAAAVAVSLQGFFLGPLFPGVVVVTTKLLPKHLHVSAIGFAAAFGGAGAAVLPFIVGVLAEAKGVQVLMPFIIALSGAILILWNFLPRMRSPPKTQASRPAAVSGYGAC